jgi:hypothetical protein
MKVCDCNNTLANQGTGCTPLFNVIAKLIAVPTYDSTGARNGIDLTDTLNEAYFTALINQSDASKRWYPLPEMKNVASPRADAVVTEWEDGTTEFVRQGSKSFTGVIPSNNANPMVLGQIESLRCGDVSVYVIDSKGSLRGSISSDGSTLYPIRLDSPSISANLQDASGTANQKMDIKFSFHPDEQDADLRMITADELGGSYLLATKGLIEVTMVISGISTTGATVKMKTPFGTQLNPVLKKGLVTADFISSVGAATSKVRNVTDGADVAVTATEDATGGTYTLAWTAQTVSDVVTVLAKSTGYSFTATNLTIV